jgi:hypothetical protein
MKKTHWNDFEMDDLGCETIIRVQQVSILVPALVLHRVMRATVSSRLTGREFRFATGSRYDHVMSNHVMIGVPHFRKPWVSTLKCCNFWMIWGYPILGNLHVCMDPSIGKPWSRTDSIWHWPAPSAVAASERDVRGEVQRAVERGGIDGGAQHEWRITG